VTWGGWQVPTLVEVAVGAVPGLVMPVVAIAAFNSGE
jgi:hypothetical protein